MARRTRNTVSRARTWISKLVVINSVKVLIAVVAISVFTIVFLSGRFSTSAYPAANYFSRINILRLFQKADDEQLVTQNDGAGRPLQKNLTEDRECTSVWSESKVRGPRGPASAKSNTAVFGKQERQVDSDYLFHHNVTFWRGRPIQVGAPHWQPLDNSSDVFVYSAHFDDVDRHPNRTQAAIVRVVGLAKKPLPYSDVWCRFHRNEDDVNSSSVPGKLYHFRNRGCNCYVGVFVDCPTTDDTPFPYTVTLEGRSHSFQTTVLKVHYSKDFSSYHNIRESTDKNIKRTTESNDHWNISNAGGPYKWNITRCFPALFNFKDSMRLSEMVAASKALGVDHFVFYEQTVSAEVYTILQNLQAEGVAELHPWNLHLTQSQVHYLAQFSAIQDCLYRHLHSSRYLLFGDVDELFVPRQHLQLLPLLEEEFSRTPECGAILFRNVFFNMGTNPKIPPLDNASASFLEHHRMPILTHIVRDSVPYKASVRSKPAVDPRKVLVGSVHIVEKLRKGFKQCTMDPEKGLLYHYRQSARMSENKTDDTFMWRFADDIVKETQRILNRISVFS